MTRPGNRCGSEPLPASRSSAPSSSLSASVQRRPSWNTCQLRPSRTVPLCCFLVRGRARRSPAGGLRRRRRRAHGARRRRRGRRIVVRFLVQRQPSTSCQGECRSPERSARSPAVRSSWELGERGCRQHFLRHRAARSKERAAMALRSGRIELRLGERRALADASQELDIGSLRRRSVPRRARGPISPRRCRDRRHAR